MTWLCGGSQARGKANRFLEGKLNQLWTGSSTSSQLAPGSLWWKMGMGVCHCCIWISPKDWWFQCSELVTHLYDCMDDMLCSFGVPSFYFMWVCLFACVCVCRWWLTVWPSPAVTRILRTQSWWPSTPKRTRELKRYHSPPLFPCLSLPCLFLYFSLAPSFSPS